MIYFLSDQHGGEKVGDLEKYYQIAGEDDLLIILGDVGFKFTDTEENRAFDELLLSAPKKVAFLDGNHENFRYIYSFPEEDWCGGKVHRITENVVHLERGYVYEIDGKSFFVFGGCNSSQKWKDLGLWQPEEAPTEQELSRAYENLKKRGNRVDYILTHKYEVGKGTRTEELLELCKYINEQTEFKHWYAGHWHTYRKEDEKHTLIYSELVSIE